MDELIERVVGGAGHRLEQFKLGWERASVPKHKLAGLQSGLVDIVYTVRILSGTNWTIHLGV